MSSLRTQRAESVGRRDFLKTGVAALASSVAAGSVALAAGESPTVPEPIATRTFDKALALISSGGFDLCMLSYGYLPRGHNQIFSARMIELRNACVAKAHELGMGIAAMKVMGAGMLGAWSARMVPEFDAQRLAQLPAAAIRYVLADNRLHLLVIGMRLPKEIDANIETLSGETTYTADDRALLAEYCAHAYESGAIQKMKID